MARLMKWQDPSRLEVVEDLVAEYRAEVEGLEQQIAEAEAGDLTEEERLFLRDIQEKFGRIQLKFAYLELFKHQPLRAADAAEEEAVQLHRRRSS